MCKVYIDMAYKKRTPRRSRRSRAPRRSRRSRTPRRSRRSRASRRYRRSRKTKKHTRRHRGNQKGGWYTSDCDSCNAKWCPVPGYRGWWDNPGEDGARIQTRYQGSNDTDTECWNCQETTWAPRIGADGTHEARVQREVAQWA